MQCVYFLNLCFNHLCQDLRFLVRCMTYIWFHLSRFFTKHNVGKQQTGLTITCKTNTFSTLFIWQRTVTQCAYWVVVTVLKPLQVRLHNTLKQTTSRPIHVTIVIINWWNFYCLTLYVNIKKVQFTYYLREKSPTEMLSLLCQQMWSSKTRIIKHFKLISDKSCNPYWVHIYNTFKSFTFYMVSAVYMHMSAWQHIITNESDLSC